MWQDDANCGDYESTEPLPMVFMIQDEICYYNSLFNAPTVHDWKQTQKTQDLS